MDGGVYYKIELNGAVYATTSKNYFTIPLSSGVNKLKVTTDQECQGHFEKIINLPYRALIYPNPFEGLLTINLGKDLSNTAMVIIRNSNGSVIYRKQHAVNSGIVSLELSGIDKGIHFLTLSLKGSETVYKIIKN
jgi:hypothetical protein